MITFPLVFLRKVQSFFNSGLVPKIVCFAIGAWVLAWCSMFIWLIITSKTVDLDLMPSTNYPTHGSDSEHYTILAENLQNQKIFSLSTQAPFVPDGFRTIGYPLFITIIKTIFQTYYLVIILQMFMVLGGGYVVYGIAQKLGLQKWSVVPAALIIFDPASFFYSFFLLSDTLFNFLLILCVWFFLKGIKMEHRRQRIINFSITGIFLGVAVLIRPIAIFLPSVFIFAHIISGYPFSGKSFLREMGFFLSCVVLVISPWIIRNYQVFNTYQLSAVGPVTFFEFTVPEFIQEKTGVPIAETRDRFHQEIQVVTDDLVIDISKTPQMMPIIKRELQGQLGPYIFFHVRKTVPFFYTSSAKIFIVGLEPFRSNPSLWHMTSYPSLDSLKVKSWADMRVLAVQTAFLLERLVWLMFFVLSILSSFLVKTKEKRIVALVCCAFIAYFALLTGPVANERYRLPAVPFLGISLALVLSDRLVKASELDLSDKM